MKPAWIALLASVSLISCSKDMKEGQPPVNDQTVQRDLMVLQGRRIYFGHQSVGFDIMKGVREYAAGDPALKIHFVTLEASAHPQGSFFADSRIGRNNYPAEKCEAFEAFVTRLDSLDVAAMKFCYADIQPTTDVDNVFALYMRTVDSLKQKFPRTTFVHVTVPYTTRTSSWKLFIKKIIGREDKSEAANFQRNKFNAMLRERYAHDPLFDLAAVESTLPDGARQSFEYQGQTVYSLAPQYTTDGGHLNETGRRLAARAFLAALASAVRDRGAQ